MNRRRFFTHGALASSLLLASSAAWAQEAPTDVDIGFCRDMAVHHVQALDMCQRVLGRDTGDPVLAARALSFTLWHVFFGFLTIPCTIVVPGGRAVQDFISGTRVVSIKVRSDT